LLLSFLNELNEAKKAGKGKETLEPVMITLLEYIKNFFVSEE
jgi:hemerythrin